MEIKLELVGRLLPEIDVALEYVWGPWARARIASGMDWPRSTILARLAREGAGASQSSRREEPSNEPAERIEGALIRRLGEEPRLLRMIVLRYASRMRAVEVAQRMHRSRRHIYDELARAHRLLAQDVVFDIKPNTICCG